MKKAIRYFDMGVKGTIFLCVSGFVVIAFAQVIFRYVLNNSITWSEELCRYLFVWMVFFGSGAGVMERKHIAVDIIPNKVPKQARRYYQLFIDIVVFCFALFIVYYSFSLAMKSMTQPSPAMQIPLGIVYMGMVLGGLVLAINICRVGIRDFNIKTETQRGGSL